MQLENIESGESEPRRQEPYHKIIGLTGGIGSGKTTVAQFIQKQGYPVYNSDQRAIELVNNDTSLKSQITQLLGAEAYDAKGAYNRKWIAGLVFENEELLKKLNAIIHPAVREDFQKWVLNQEKGLVFQETALLFENQLNVYCFKTILVTASQNIRIKRVMDRDGKTYREVENVVDNQMQESEKESLADYVILNHGTLEELEAQTLDVIQKLEEHL